MSADHDYLDPSQWMGTKELCAILGIAPRTLWNAHSIGQDLPPVYKQAHRLRFYRPEVEAYLLRQRKLTPATQLRERAAAQATA